MNRDEYNALGRAIVSVLVGAAILGLLADLLGWWTVGIVFAAAIADQIRCALSFPKRWTRL